MTDVLDSDVITDEFQIGGGSPVPVSSVVPTSQPEEFLFGSINVGEPGIETVDNPISSVVDEEIEVSSPSESSSTMFSSSPSSDGDVSLDNLRAVSSMFDNGCQTFQALVEGTGLSSATVNACIKWLKDNGLLAVGNKFYCTIDNVGVLQSQLKACTKCFGKV